MPRAIAMVSVGLQRQSAGHRRPPLRELVVARDVIETRLAELALALDEEGEAAGRVLRRDDAPLLTRSSARLGDAYFEMFDDACEKHTVRSTHTGAALLSSTYPERC